LYRNFFAFPFVDIEAPRQSGTGGGGLRAENRFNIEMPLAMIQEGCYYFPPAANTLVIKYSSLEEATAWSEEAFCTSHGHHAVAAGPVVAFYSSSSSSWTYQ
jgi:hypothetical protein